MRKLAVSTFLLAVAVTLPLQARGKNESYISYDDGGTVVRQGDDNNREIDARVNLPVFPGDEVITNRRGRTEVRLADGNVIGIDRATSLLFRSILDSYDKDSNDTIAELRYGKVAIFRVSDARESLRLDTPSASYFAGNEAAFSIESDSHGRDHVAVFEGTIEVRTPSKTSRVRAGESAEVDDRGLYDLASDERTAADDFDRWFLQRSEKFGTSNSRYLDRSLAYSDEDLSRHGSWTLISGFGWGWRPFVSAGWRPYYNGQWDTGPSGSLTWVSYEPWGWVPYHYGRWSYEPTYGWFWLPGAAYSPAWVYWMYSPGYIGWAPAGWYDCYRPYYDWAYRPYARAGLDFGFGFYGRVHVREVDLRPWTFVDANTIMSGRIDRAAIGADLVRARLTRGPGDLATISGTPAKFGRNDLRDPAGAVNEIYRRGLTGGTGQVVPATDMTPFFRRDNELPATVRDRIIRTRPTDGVGGLGRTPAAGGGLAPIGSGSLAPIGSGSLAPIGRGSVAPIGGGAGSATSAPSTGGSDGRIHRGDSGGWRGNSGGTGASPTPRENGNGRVNRGGGNGTVHRDATIPEPAWRNRVNRTFPAGIDSGDRPAATAPAPPRDNWRGRSDVPRRVIDGIGGTRIYRGVDRYSAPPPRAEAPRPPARESSPPRAHESAPHRESGGSHSDGGKVHRDKS